jgi:Flp pilus assembly pilin Flp
MRRPILSPILNPLFALVRRLGRDEAGFILSAELVLIATIIVIGLVVGLSEISTAVNGELFDIARSYGSLNGNSDGRYSTLSQNGSEPESGGGTSGGGGSGGTDFGGF